MSLSSQVSSLATRLGQEVKALWIAINAKAPIDSPTFTNNVVNNGAYIRVNNASAAADMEIKSGTGSVYHVMKASNSSGTGNNYTEYWKLGVRYWLLTVTDAAYTLGYRDSGGTTVNAFSVDRSSFPGRILLTRSTVSGDTALTVATKDYVDTKVSKIASSTDNAIARFDSTAGAIQNSAVTIDDNGKIATVAAASGYAPIKITPGTAPSAPVDGDLWTATAGVYYRNGSVTEHVPRVSVSGTAPASPVDGDLWIDNTTPAWTAPTLTNSWVNYGDIFTTAGYYKDALGIIHLKGLVKSGTTSNAIFTLPTGYRPSQVAMFTVVAGPGVARIDISTNGAVYVAAYMASGTNAYVSLDGITFATF